MFGTGDSYLWCYCSAATGNPQVSQEDEEGFLNRNTYSSPNMTSDMMEEFLKDPQSYLCAVTLLYPRAVQKSYTNERRFFCPPPAVKMEGRGWMRVQGKSTVRSNDFLATCKIDNLVRTMVYEMHMPKQPPTCQGYLQFQTMSISKLDNKKIATLSVALTTNTHNPFVNNTVIGTVTSERIKVISKPSKKRGPVTSASEAHISILNGSKIALYTRMRSQTVNTRFMNVQEKEYMANGDEWTVFEIQHAYPNQNETQDEQSQYIKYGDTVILIDVVTGLSLPPLRIHQVFKSKNTEAYTIMETNDPVCQLHMVCFIFVEPGSEKLLTSSKSEIVFTLMDVNPTQPREVVDAARWTIILAERLTFQFAPLRKIESPVFPVPMVTKEPTAEYSPDGSTFLSLSFDGKNFSRSLSVWFGPMETVGIKVTSVTRLECKVPPLTLIFANNNINVPVPIWFSRQDGIVFPTGYALYYDSMTSKTSVIEHEIEIDTSPPPELANSELDEEDSAVVLEKL